MKIRRAILLLGSAALGAVLVLLLVRLGKVNLAAILRQLGQTSLLNLFKLVALNVLVVGLSTAKWRSIDAVLRRESDAVPSRITAFSMSSVGMALGLLLPVQMGMTAARTAGTHLYGRTLKRGTGGTLFEQSFDLLTVMLLAVASAVTWLSDGGIGTWAICATVSIAGGLVAMQPMLWLFRRVVSRASASVGRRLSGRVRSRPGGLVARLLEGCSEVEHSGLANTKLARHLLILSAARFGALVLIACQTASIAGADISPWRMLAATPFAGIANLIAITPGAVGVNELTYATALHMFGIPLDLASSWALTNRVLVTGSCFVVMAITVLAVCAGRLFDSSLGALRRAKGDSAL